MPTLADSLVSSAARPLAIRMRPDLNVTKQRYQGREFWIVKDPVGLHYYRFQEEEFCILNWLDGRTSLDDLRRRFEKQFAPQKIALEELGRLIGMLHQSGLVIAGVPGQGRQLLKRRGERARKELVSKLSNVLAIRFKGIDPERILNWLDPKFGWIFSKYAVAIWLFTFLAALTLVLVNYDTFTQRLPGFHEFFGPSNWFYLAIAMGLTKVLHEFGHGLSCKHFGGECHEMGVMFLVLTPCLYCNVSDSWMLPNKWHRAFIGAAGMYVEVFLASIATFIWWNTTPGTLVNQLALSTMFVCSVSTVIFNGNPLLRYDGYYILSDLMEIPNLRQKATTILSRKLGKWCLGLEEPDDPFLPKKNQGLFMLYTVASSVYSWIVLFSILWFLNKVFEPYRLKVLGQIIAAASIASLIGRPLWGVIKFFRVPGRTDQVKKPRMYATIAILLAIAGVVLFVPFPYRVYSAFEVRARDADPIYAVIPGELVKVNVSSGDRVKAGDVLAELENDELQLQVAQLVGQRDQLRAQLNALRRERRYDSKASGEIAHIRESLEATEEQLEKKQRDLDRLTLRATRDGVVIPPPSVAEQPSAEGKLPTWSGTPLERRNLNATLTAGTSFCQIGDPDKLEAILVIDQEDEKLVHKGQKVKMMLATVPGKVFHGTISDKSLGELEVIPRALSPKAGGEVIAKTDPNTGIERPASTSYQAHVLLDDQEGLLVPGLKGEAKIDTQWRSLGWRFWRFMQRTFHFKL